MHTGDTHSVTMQGTGAGPGGAGVPGTGDRWAADADRSASDVFTLGTRAYFLLSGGGPGPRSCGVASDAAS